MHFDNRTFIAAESSSLFWPAISLFFVSLFAYEVFLRWVNLTENIAVRARPAQALGAIDAALARP